MDKIQIKVLLIEDNPVDMVLLREALGQDALNSFELTAVERLQAAAETLLENNFDVILLDLGLPDSQGLETFSHLHGFVPETPKIILSGLTDESLALQAVHIGAQDYLVKGTTGFASAARAIRYAIERQKAQAAVRASEEHYRYLFENNPHPMWAYDLKTLAFLAVNEAAVNKYGYTREEFLGMTIADIRPVEDVQRLRESVMQPRLSPLNHAGEWRHKLKDGTLIDVDISSHTLNLLGHEAALIVAQDITERKRVEAAVHASEERFRAMIENGLDDISLLDANGTLLWESPSVIRSLGYLVDTFVGKNIFEIVHPEDQGWTSDLYAKVLQAPGSREAGTFRLRHADGSWRWIEALVTNMLNNPSVQAIVVNYRDITERKQAEEALRSSDERYRGIFDGVRDAIFVEDLEGRILDVNQRACELYGYSHAEFITKNVSDIVPSVEQIILFKDENEFLGHSYETINVRADGRRFPVEVRVGSYEFENRKLFLVVLRDITERKQSEIIIEQQHNDLRLINAINTAVVQGVSLPAIMDLLSKELKQVFDIEGTSIYLLDPDGQSLAMQQFVISPELTRSIEKVIGSTVPLIHIPIQAGGYFEKFIQAGLGTIMNDPEEIQQWMAEFVETSFLPPVARNAVRKLIPQIYKLMRFQSTIIAPLISNGKTIGLLDASSSTRLFTNEDLRRIENICGHLTAAIQRQQANERVLSSEAFLNSVQNALTANLAILDENGTIVRVNAAWRKFGEQNGLKTPDACIGMNYLEVCDSATGKYAEEAHATAAAIRSVIIGHRKDMLLEYPCHSPHEQRWFTLRITKFEDGEHIWVVLAHENITERKLAEQQTLEIEKRFRALIERAPDGIVLVSAEGKYKYASPTALRLFNYSLEETLVGDPNASTHPDDLPAVLGLLQDLIEHPAKTATLQYRFRHKDGTWRWLESTFTNMLAELGVEAIVINFRDITDRKQAEEATRETSEQFRTLFEASPEAIMLVDPQGDWQILDCNATGCVMNGYTRNELIGQSVDIFNAAPGNPAERSAYLERVRNAGILRYETTHRRKDGTVFPIEVSTSLIRLGGREVILGIDRDITERKQAEEALHKSEALYRQAIEVAGAVPYYESYYDNGQRIKYDFIGEGIRQITGYGPEEFNAQVWDALVEEVTLVEELSGYSLNEGIQRVRSGASPIWKCEHRIRDREGYLHWVFEAAVELRDEQGGAYGSIGTYQDITARKQVEEALRKSEQRYRALFEDVPVPIWEQDFSEVKKHLETLKAQGVQNLSAYLASNPDAVLECANKVRILDVNNTAIQLYRATNKDELITDTHQVLSLGEQEHFHEFLAAVAEGRTSQSWEGADETMDGEPMQISLTWSVAPGYEADFSKVIVTTVDITERKQAADQLQRSHSLLTAALESTADGILVVDGRGNISNFNKKFLELWKIPDSLVEKKDDHALLEFVVKQLKDPAAFLAKVEMLYQAPEMISFDELEFNDGRVYERYSQPQRLGADIIGRVWSFHDITERKQNEQKLFEANERFRQLADNIQEVFWITDAVTGKDLYISPAGERVWGHAIEDLMQVPDIFINSILPADRPAVLSSIEKQRNGQSTELEYRVVHADGSTHWVWDRAFPIFDKMGKLVRLAGIAADVTERKQAQEKIRESENRYRGLFENMVNGFALHEIITDDQGQPVDYRFLEINPAFEKLTSIKAELSIGRQAREILPGIENEGFIQKYGKVALTGEPLHFEAFSSPLKKYFDIHAYSPKLGQFAVTFTEITARKQSENAAMRHLSELEALYENGLAIGRLLDINEIAQRIIATFEKYLAWHHVAIRLIKPESANMEMELIAFNQAGLNDESNQDAQRSLSSKIFKVGQGLSGWVAQTGQALRTGNVNSQLHYIATYMDINSGLYMPLKMGERCIGVISVESHEPDAFSEQDERLLATLANQAAIAFENARLYQSVQQELLVRKRAEEQLRISETHYRQLTDSITDIMFELDRELRYSHWNRASEILTGVPEAQALGRSMREIFGPSDEQVRIEQVYKDVLMNQRSRTLETLFKVDNQLRSFEINAYPSTRGIAVVAKDITERKRSQVVLQKRFELMEYAAQHSLEEIMQRANDEVSNLTNSVIGFFQILDGDEVYPALQIWPTNTLNFFTVPLSEGRHRPLDQAGVWADAVRERRAIIHNDYESLPHKKGLPVGHGPIVREMVIPIIRNEKIRAVMGVANKATDYTQTDLELAERFADYAWDITERKRMEVMLAEERDQLAVHVEERTADLSRANANLARALRVKDEFLANMSHELRTPLNAILGLSESLAEQTAGPLNEKQLRYINTVSESGHHLLSLINDILDLAKIEAGQITLDVNRVDIHSVCETSLRMIKQLARKKNQETFLEIDQGIGLMWADERRLKQMLVNLLSNAVKFTPNDGKLGLEVHGDREANKVTFTIWDTGIGIKEADLQRLFQPFVQLDAGLARESSGTGLGLALVAQMARLHGGSASVVSEPGKGSRFTIMLPWEQALAVDTVERLKITGKFRPIKFSKERKPIILLVEDTEDVIMMISDYLELNGFKVVTARDGVEGVTQAQLTHPDLILMDIQMPRMDGFEATQKLRSEPDFKKTPIIALTALAMPNDRERCLAAGMDEYITKPVHLRALVKLVENILAGDQEVQPK